MEFINKQDILREMAVKAVSLACKQGADEAEASASESAGFEAQVRVGVLDDLEINRGQGLSVTVFINHSSGSAGISRLDSKALQTAVDKAITIARASAADPCAGLADKELMAHEFPDLSLYHPWDITPENAITLARKCEESSWAAHPAVSRKKSVGATVSTSATQEAYANSHGFCAVDEETTHAISCGALAEKDGAMEQDGWDDCKRTPEQLKDAVGIGHTAGERAAKRLGGRKISATRAAVLFQAPAAHSLIGHLVGAASGGALYHRTSWLSDKLETSVCSAHINIREEPYRAGELHSDSYDDDGVATKSRDIVKNGVWLGCFLSAYSARRLGMKSTGNAGGAHNLEVSGETMPYEQIIKTIKRGLIVTDLMGQGVNGVTGDYSRGAAGFWVENGEIVHPASELTIAGNLCDMLKNIAAVGDDDMRRGLVKCGSILIPDMAIGGNQ